MYTGNKKINDIMQDDLEEDGASLEKPTLTVEKPAMLLEKQAMSLEKSAVSLEKPVVSLEKPALSLKPYVYNTFGYKQIKHTMFYPKNGCNNIFDKLDQSK